MAFANSSPGLEQPWGIKLEHTFNAERRSRTPAELSIPSILSPGLQQPWGIKLEHTFNADGVRELLSELSIPRILSAPGLQQPWAEICQRLRRSS